MTSDRFKFTVSVNAPEANNRQLPAPDHTEQMDEDRQNSEEEQGS